MCRFESRAISEDGEIVSQEMAALLHSKLAKQATGSAGRSAALQRAATKARLVWALVASAPGAFSRRLLAVLLLARQALSRGLSLASLAAAVRRLGARKASLLDGLEFLSPKAMDGLAAESGLRCPCPVVTKHIPMDREVEDPSEVCTALSVRTKRSSWEPVEDEQGLQPNAYQAMLGYVRGFLAKPHASVGRPGPVCPFVPKTLQLDCMKMAVVRTAHLPKETLRTSLASMLLEFLPKFEAMEPCTGRQRQYKTVLFVFPDVPLASARDVIDGAQADAKPEFVAKGLMVGEFHAANNATGLRNSNFYPLRTPHPCLAIRHMVPGDYVFMTLENYALDLQRKFLSSFLDVFGEEDRAETRDARARLQALPQEAVEA